MTHSPESLPDIKNVSQSAEPLLEVKDVSKIVQRLMRVRMKGGMPFKISYMKKSAAELVAEGRGG